MIGAGIVGMSCAFQLQQRGYQVTVLDPVPPGESCSFGNAGVIANSFCLPIVTPSTLAQAPRWLLDRNGMISVSPGYLPRMLPWLMQGARAARQARVDALSKALNSLHASASEEHERQAREAGCPDLLARRDYLHVYESERSFRGDARHWQARQRFGIRFRELVPGELMEVEPNLSGNFARAVLMEGQSIALDPGGLVKAVATAFQERQGRIIQHRVHNIGIEAPGDVQVDTTAGTFSAKHLVVAAGAWSADVAMQLGYRFPLAAERGYHLIYDDPAFTLNQPIMFADYKFVANSMRMGLRVAGTAEFASVDAPASEARWARLHFHAQRFFPGIANRNRGIGARWVGPRPSLPDTLPVIGRAKGNPQLIFAFGHSHTGLTAGPITGRIVADLVEGKPPPIDISPFSPDRF